MSTQVGFIGLGVMGQPMAQNLLRAGYPLWVWNRTPEKAQALVDAGARWAESVEALFANTEVVIFMLANEGALNAVLGRGRPRFAQQLRGRTLIQMGTTSAAFSLALAREVEGAGGHYVEAPVSGSRLPAESGQLLALLAGEGPVVARVRHLMAPMCQSSFLCGPVPKALQLKLSVNLFLIAMVGALCEAVHFAQSQGLSPQLFQAVLDAGPMASQVSRGKLPKLLQRDFSVQAALGDVRMNAELIAQAAHQAQVSTPLLGQCLALLQEAESQGLAGEDMVAWLQAWEALSLA